jgi:hypothetical protein
MRTWNHWEQHSRDGHPIDLQDYEAIGTMTDALSRHAEEAYGELTTERSRQIAERVFKALTETNAEIGRTAPSVQRRRAVPNHRRDARRSRRCHRSISGARPIVPDATDRCVAR